MDNKISFWVLVDDGDIQITQKRPRKPDFTLKMPLSDLGGIASGQLDPQDLVEQGRASSTATPTLPPAPWHYLAPVEPRPSIHHARMRCPTVAVRRPKSQASHHNNHKEVRGAVH